MGGLPEGATVNLDHPYSLDNYSYADEEGTSARVLF